MVSRSLKTLSLPYQVLKCLPKPSSEFFYSLLCDWSMLSSANLSLAGGKMRKKFLVTGGFRQESTESQAASCKHLHTVSKSPLTIRIKRELSFRPPSWGLVPAHLLPLKKLSQNIHVLLLSLCLLLILLPVYPITHRPLQITVGRGLDP